MMMMLMTTNEDEDEKEDNANAEERLLLNGLWDRYKYCFSSSTSSSGTILAHGVAKYRV